MPLSSCFSSLINLVCVLCLCLSFLFLQFFPYLFGFLLSPPPTPKFGSFLIYFMRTLKVFRQYSFYLNLLRWNFIVWVLLWLFLMPFQLCSWWFLLNGSFQFLCSTMYQSSPLWFCLWGHDLRSPPFTPRLYKYPARFSSSTFSCKK